MIRLQLYLFCRDIWIIRAIQVIYRMIFERCSDMEQLEFLTDDNEKVSFYVLEETRVNGVNYLLVSEQDSLDAECYILKDVSSQESAEAAYEFVEDDNELDSVFKIFQELVDDEEV